MLFFIPFLFQERFRCLNYAFIPTSACRLSIAFQSPLVKIYRSSGNGITD